MKLLKTHKLCYLVGLTVLLASNIGIVEAKRKLVATSLVTCMENSQLSANSFDVVFDPDDRSLHYDLDMSTQIDSYVFADIDVYAYGFKIITKNVDLCSINWKQFCPVHPGNIQIDSIEYISSKYVNDIPGIAYQVPDIDAYARVKITNNVSDYLACIQIYFSNGKTVSQIGVKWATAVVAGIGLLLSAILSTFGNSTAASHISANTMSLFLYFQSVVVVSMQHVHRVPPIAAAWAENLVWSMGLIKISFMQRIFRWYVQSTGGTPSLYLTSTTMSVLAQRSWQYLMEFSLMRRATNVLYGNANTLIFRGIKRLGYKMGIENTSIVCTGFTFFVLCGYVLAGFIIVVKCCVELAIRLGWIQKTRFWEFRKQWKTIMKGALLRYVYIGFVQLTILSFWEFTERDSAAVIVIACLFILLSCGLMLWAAWRTVFFAKRSVAMYSNPAALLYGDEYVLHKYGFFYTMFNANRYWWNIVLLSYIFVKSLLVGFAQASGQTQVLFMFILDLFYFIAIIYYKPYLDRPTNIMNILIATVTVVNSFLFMFFSDLFNQSYKVASIMGWIFFIMNAAFSFILLLMILAFAGMILFSKNPDLRFKPAKDDRTSFQRNTTKPVGSVNRSVANELLALGNVARDHNYNSDYESNDNEVNDDSKQVQDEITPTTVTSSDDNKPTLSEKIFSKLTGQKNNNTSTDVLKDESPKQQTFLPNLTNLSRENLSKLGPKSYPGHTRAQSDAHNGLIDSLDEEDTSSTTDPFHDSTEGDLLDSSSSDGGFRSQNFVRDDSLNSLGNNQQPIRKPPGFFDEGFM
ncbi:YGL139W [Saccharomyces arboricola H-6]|uniref:YGL139W n=1 Tax=Saccharomyces arboricola (strain H-6 / AS 2.3317 / CBS 10644) TaxID=1160507 RepID=J8Q8B3_SACAR|nr:YGL139W [Saccharomyces arboricola H-6]